MQFTQNVARVSIAAFLAALVIVVTLWIRSSGRIEFVQYQGENYFWRLTQSDEFVAFSMEPGIGRDRFGIGGAGFYYADEGEVLVSREGSWWGKPVFDAEIEGPFGSFLLVGFPHWFALCFSLILLAPATIHWRMKKKHTEQGVSCNAGNGPV
jgi:hypothetical protein